jgi:hypothetical protein
MCSAATRSALAARLRQTGVDHQGVAVLHQGVAHEAELGLLARPFAIQLRLRVRRRGVRVVRALLTMKVRFPIAAAPVRRRLVRSFLRLKTLHRCPGFDQRAIDRKMIRAQEPLHARLRQNRAQQLGGDVALQKPIAVLGERRVVPCHIVHADPDEPAEQQVELQPVHQLALRANRIKGLQQHRPQQFLRRNRGATHRRIQNRKIARQTRQGLIHDGADRPKRMVLAHAIFKIDVTEQRPRPLVPASHRAPPEFSRGIESQRDSRG